jgi:hypothetical protein
MDKSNAIGSQIPQCKFAKNLFTLAQIFAAILRADILQPPVSLPAKR